MKRKVLFLAVSSLFADAALAQTPVFTSASAGSSASTGQHTTVSQGTQRAIFDWASFNIGQGNSVTFTQPNSSSVAVNRIAGGRSTIDGILTANGHIMLLNRNGVLFGSTAIVNVGSLTASTGKLAATDADFVLPANSTAPIGIIEAISGSIENRGTITAGTVAQKGLVAFVAPSVINSGTITAIGGRIVLAGAQAATSTLALNGLYEFTIDTGVNGSVAKNIVEDGRIGTLNTGTAGGTIVVSALDAANLVSGVINLEGVQRASRIEVRGGVVHLSSDLEAATVTGDATTIHVSGNGKLQDAVAIAKDVTSGPGATINVNGGTYSGEVTLDKNNLTVTGSDNATLSVAAGERGFNITKDGVTVEKMKIVGPYSQSYTDVNWSDVNVPTTTAGVTLQPGVNNATIRDNDIRNVRTGVQILGTTTGTRVLDNIIDNTKGSILLRSSGVAMTGNKWAPLGNGNEWDIVFLNNIADGAYFTSPNVDQKLYGADMMAMSVANNGMHILDRRYGSRGLLSNTPQFGNRSHIVVSVGSSFTAEDDFDLGNGLGNARQPLGFINAGINAVVAGGKVDVAAGTYTENVAISKALTLKGAGAGSTFIDPVSGDAVSISGNMGASATLTIDGFTFRDAPRYGVRVAGDTVLRELVVRNSNFVGNGQNGFAVLGGATTGVPGLAKVSLVNDNFVGNGTSTPSSLGYGDILFNFYNGDATFKDLHITGAGEFIGIQMRGMSPTANSPRDAGTVEFDNVTIDGSFRRPDIANTRAPYFNVGTWNPGGPGDAIHLQEYASVANVSFNNVVINLDAGHGMFLEGLGTTLNIGNTRFGLNTNLTELGVRPDDSAAQKRLRVSRNIFVGSNDNGLVTKVNASGATFSDAASGFAIEDRVYHALDTSGLGLVTWNPGHLYVTADSGSIQRGINAACECDTVHVGPGTFTEQLKINKSLILLGSGASNTIVEAPTSLVVEGGMKSILTISGPGTDAEVSGFTFKGPGAGLRAGIFVRDGAHAYVHNNSVINIRGDNGVGIFVGRAALATAGSADIVNNIITGYQKGGIVVDGPGSSATITGNTITGDGPTTLIAQNGIQVSRGANATVTGNTVSGNVYTGHRSDPDDFAAGILFFISNGYLGQGGINVGSGNTITANEFGVWTNDSRTLATTSLAGVSGNTRDAVAYFSGGYAAQDPLLLKYPAWTASNAALVNAGTFGTKQSGDIVDVGGTLKVAGWNAFGAIQPAVNAVADGASIDVASGTYAESVVLNGLRNLTFNNVTLQGLTISPGAAGSGIGGSVIANGPTGFLFNAPIRLLSDTSLATTGARIAFNGDIQTAGGAPYALSLNAGGGDVSMVSGGTQANPLGHFDVLADDFSLASTLWVSGYDINASGNVSLSNSTLNSLGVALAIISAGGSVTGSTTSQGNVQISGGDVTTNILSLGNVAVVANNVGGNITGSFIVIDAQNNVVANVTAQQVAEIQAGGTVEISGSAQTLVIKAASGSATGNFGEVVNTGSVVSVNGVPLANVRILEASAQQLLPTKVVTAADSEAGPTTPAGGMKPTLKLLTAETKEAQPRSGLSNAAELLRQGQSVEIDLTPGNN